MPVRAPATFDYAGWIPTISGQLAFSLVGKAGAVPDATAFNEDILNAAGLSRGRAIAVLQRRTSRDVPLPQWMLRLFIPRLTQTYVMVADTEASARPVIGADDELVPNCVDTIGRLTGWIYMIPHQRTPATNRIKTALVKDLKRLINSMSGKAKPHDLQDVSRLLKAQIETGTESAADISTVYIAKARFALHRTGEFRLNMIDDGRIAAGDPKRPIAVARQMYYFAKDAAHRHFHHHNGADNLLPLTPVVDGDDVSWRRETLWSLVRATLELRRSARYPDNSSALGVLAYAEAFQALLARVRRKSGDGSGDAFALMESLAFYDFDHTRQSLEATAAKHAFRSSVWHQFQAVVVAVVLATPALWIAAIQVRDVSCRGADPKTGCGALPPEWAIQLVSQAIARPGPVFLFVLLVGLIYLVFVRNSLTSVPFIRAFGDWVDGWLDALGASISIRLQNLLPAPWPDRVGAIVGQFFYGAPAFLATAYAGAALKLWGAPPFSWMVFAVSAAAATGVWLVATGPTKDDLSAPKD